MHLLLFRISEMGSPSLLNPVVLTISGDNLCQCHCDLNKQNCDNQVAVCEPEAYVTSCQPNKFKPHLRQRCESSRKRRAVEDHKDDYSDLERPPYKELPDLDIFVCIIYITLYVLYLFSYNNNNNNNNYYYYYYYYYNNNRQKH